MMAPRRMVWVRNAEGVFGRSKDALKNILDYIDAPDETTCLVFESSVRIKKNSALYKRIQKSGQCYEAKPCESVNCRAGSRGVFRRGVGKLNRMALTPLCNLLVEILPQSMRRRTSDALRRGPGRHLCRPCSSVCAPDQAPDGLGTR